MTLQGLWIASFQSRPRLYMCFYHNKYAHTKVEDQHKNWGEGPGLIYCVSGHEVDSGGGERGGYIQTDACYYQSRWVASTTQTFDIQFSHGVLERSWCIAYSCANSTPLHLVSSPFCLTLVTWWIGPGLHCFFILLFLFLTVFDPCYLWDPHYIG